MEGFRRQSHISTSNIVKLHLSINPKSSHSCVCLMDCLAINFMLNVVIFTHLFYCLVVFSTATSVMLNTATAVTALSTTVTAPISSFAITSGMFTS